MTSQISQRRSKRIADIQSSQSVVYDQDIDHSDYDDEEEEEEYQVANTRKRKSTKQASNKQKRFKNVKPLSLTEEFTEQRDNFEENYLFQALNDGEASITEQANDWVEQYKANKDLAKKDLINLILNAVGCFTTIEEHDVSNNESASETVGEIQTFFKRQKIHEFYLLSKKPEYKHLKKNYIEFITQIIHISDENGTLYENITLNEDEQEEEDDDEEREDSNVMEDLLVWLSSFSVSSVRALRFISTLSLLTIETTLCKAIKKNNSSIENFNHQLETERKKKATAAIKKRIAQTEENLQAFSRQSSILQRFIKDIVNTTFIHRFKDTDPLIRVEAMTSLGNWMDIYPELFFKVTYLKYLGWVLSDENSSVRLQVIKTLIKLLKQNVIVTGLRQFFERFKERIIEIAFNDIDHHVKTNSILLISEIYKTGFLEDEETAKVSSLIFTTQDKKAISLIANFVQQIEKEKTSEATETLEVAIASAQDLFPINVQDAIRIRKLLEVLNEAQQYVEDQGNSELKTKKLDPSKFAIIAKTLLASSAYSDLWESLIKYFLLDFSSVKRLNKDLRKVLSLNSTEENILLNFIYGLVLKLNEDDNESQTATKKEETETKIQNILPYFPLILKEVENHDENLSVFIQIFTTFPLSLYETTNQTNIFKDIYSTFLKVIKNNSIISLKNEYLLLLKNLSIGEESTVIQEIQTSYRSYLSELFISLNAFINDPSYEEYPNYELLYERYILKLLVLGITFDISEIYSTFSLFKDLVLSPLEDYDIEERDVVPISSVFKTFLSATSWKLNNLLKTNENVDIEKELNIIPGLLDCFYDVLNNKKIILSLRSEVSITLIDLLTILKNFFEEYRKSSKSNLSNVERFQDIDLSSFRLDDTTSSSFLDIFLSKEAIFGNSIESVLDRDDDEDVNLNSLKITDDDEEGISQYAAWELEKDLAVYTAKLLKFYKSGFLNEKLIDRIRLNSSELGELFSSIVEDGLQEEQKKTNITSAKQQSNTQHSEEEDIVGEDDAPVIDMED